jgi:hypothetical protein
MDVGDLLHLRYFVESRGDLMSAISERTMTVSTDVLAILRTRLTGTVLTENNPGYEDARTIWNAMIDARPAIIALPETAEDVAELVRFAAREHVPLAVRGGGHNIAGTAVADGGLTINMSHLNAIEYDAAANRVTIGAGTNWGEVDAALEPLGLIVPGGLVSTTGVAGFTLGGGFGWLTRSEGYTTDRLTGATIVTADGQIRSIDQECEPELFWAIRGGGGNFGVVTEFVFEPVTLGPEIVGGMVLWSIDQAPAIIDLYRREAAAAPDELMHVLVLRVAPPAPFLPVEVHGKPVVGIAAMYAGPVEDGMRAMEPISSFSTSLANSIKPKPYREHQAFLDAGQPFGRRYYWKSVYFDDFSDGVEQALLEHGTRFRSGFSSVLLPHLGVSGSAMAPGKRQPAIGARSSW